jgi:hypothetical protein
VAGLLASGAARAHAQPTNPLPELVTDRPDFTESSVVVGPGIVQVEGGTTFEVEGPAETRHGTLSTPLALVRVGLSRRIEARFSTNGYIRDSYGSALALPASGGQADIEVGAKVVLREAPGRGLALAIIPMVSLPTGTSGVSSDAFDPTLKVTWATTLPRAFGLSGNLNIERLGDDEGRYTQHVVSVSLGRELARGWAGYVETFGAAVSGRPEMRAWTVDGGVTYGIGDHAQIDLEVGRGLTASASDWTVGIGFGIRTAAFAPGR